MLLLTHIFSIDIYEDSKVKNDRETLIWYSALQWLKLFYIFDHFR